jgi:predicted TIM-barrel fold metal-dependent hydrolase
MGSLDTPADRGTYPQYPIRAEGVVPKLFRRYPNMYGDLSAGSGYNAFARDPANAVKFLNEFQDRLLFGTDICYADQPLPMADFLKDLLRQGKLPESAFAKISRDNAIALLGL